MNLEKAIAKIRKVADDAQELFQKLKAVLKGDSNAEVSGPDGRAAQRLVERAESAQRDLEAAAKGERTQRLRDLRVMQRRYRDALLIPGISEEKADEIQSRLDEIETEIADLETTEGTDFSGLISDEEWEQIEAVVAQAKKEVAQKKRVAEIITTLVQVGDLALTIAGKLVKAGIA